MGERKVSSCFMGERLAAVSWQGEISRCFMGERKVSSCFMWKEVSNCFMGERG